MDNESRMALSSPEATPVSPASSADSPIASSVKVTNGKKSQKSGTTNAVPSTSTAPPQPNVHDASYMMMGKRNVK